jgi:uncharacterized cofD-like protein
MTGRLPSHAGTSHAPASRGPHGAETQRPRVVAIGGGHGLWGVLSALRQMRLAPTAVVTVADDGGSSGRLRRDLGIIAPGDLRMALLALARNAALAQALGHRFGQGELAGHALGNLFLVALSEQQGSFVGALRQAGELLDCQGVVLPSTTQPVELHAEADGEHLHGQVRVATADHRIERVWLEPSEPEGCREAVRAIERADVVLLGPGSLFTSVIVNLLVPEIAAAVVRTRATLVHLANMRTQVGETTGLDLDAHLGALLPYLDGRSLDATVIHDGPLSAASVGAQLRGVPQAEGIGAVITADLVTRDAAGRPGDAHDPRRLAAVLTSLFHGGRTTGPRLRDITAAGVRPFDA